MTGRKEEDVDASVAAPTPIVRRYVRYVVGFGVAVGIGLAPFLGKIPGADALLTLLPFSLQDSLIPLSAFLMGLIAVAIQFYSGETLRHAALRRRFGVTWLLLLAGFFLLFCFHFLFVVPIPYTYNEGRKTARVIIGSSRIRGESCKCVPSDGDKECIRKLTLNPATIETCWDAGEIQFRGLLLSLSYLMVTGGFGALIGLLLLTEQARQQQKRRPRKATVTSPGGS